MVRWEIALTHSLRESEAHKRKRQRWLLEEMCFSRKTAPQREARLAAQSRGNSVDANLYAVC